MRFCAWNRFSFLALATVLNPMSIKWFEQKDRKFLAKLCSIKLIRFEFWSKCFSGWRKFQMWQNIETDNFLCQRTGTYMGRSRRHVRDFSVEISQAAINAAIAERQILGELGPKACVMEEPCKLHATRKAKRGAQPEWSDILRWEE